MKRTLLAFLIALAPLTACETGSGDDVPDPVDAAIDGDPGDGMGPDGPGACVLPSATITCTVGNDGPCTAVCGGAYCYNFSQVGNVCTNNCTPGNNSACPTGWTCNNMGRCRPPG